MLTLEGRIGGGSDIFFKLGSPHWTDDPDRS